MDFGINFAKGQVFGFLLNDAGKGINGVTIELQGGAAPRMVQTKMDGKFTFPGLEPGTYSVTTQTASISGFEVVTPRQDTDSAKDVAIDDLTFNTPTSPPPPFSVRIGGSTNRSEGVESHLPT